MKKFFCILISLLIVMSSIISAQNIKKISKAGNVNRFTQVQAPQVYLYRNQLNKVVTTNFLVTYETNVPSEAQTAFDKAVEIWSYLIVLSKPVKIKVKFVNDPNSGMLGGTGIPSWRNNFTNVPVVDRQYPVSLAKHLDNSINYTENDIEMEFNGANSFNYSLDGIPVADHFDFVTVALHEIGHGLGLFGSFDVQQNEGYYGYNGYPVFTTNTYPTIADQFYLNGSTRLINVTSSSTLGGLLQNNNVWYDGTNAKNANNNQNIKMYAPSVWEPGSSIDHLDEITFPAGNINSLMTPTLDPAEVNHNPGPIFLGMLKDYGHTVGRIITFTAPLSNNNIVKGQNFNITWHDNISGFGDYINFELYKVTAGDPLLIGSINENSYIFSNPGTQGNSYTWSVPTSLENNFYFIIAEGSNHLVDYGQSQIFTISNIPEAPKFNPPGRQYNIPQWVSLYTNSPVTEIRYTLNGTEPNETSALFTSPILVDASKTIRAKSILVLPNGTKVLSPSSDATYFIGSNSFVKEFTSPYYGYYGRNGSYDNNSAYEGLNIGKAQSNYVYRSFIDWNNIRTQIPAGSIIQSVEVVLPLEPFYTPASIEFREFVRAPYWTQNWDSISSGTLIATMNANSSPFNINGLVSKVQNIVNGIGGDLVRIGIKNANETEYSHFVQFPWNNPVLRVYYRGNVEISQLDKDDQPFGQVGYWNGSVWENKNVPATVFKSGSITLKSHQGYKENTTQKYYKWLDQTDIVNHTTISISTGVNYFTSKFIEANLSPKVKNFYTETSNLNPGTDKIWIKDPWLIDEMDAQYGLRNQGISGGTTGLPGADWYQLESPIDFSDPAYSNYKGVFLNQGITPQGQWQPPYYSVKVDAVQDISLTNTGVPSGRNHKFYFQNWSRNIINGTPSAEFQDSMALLTPVVFKYADAVVSANLKGTQLTNTVFTDSKSGQRGFLRDHVNGYLHNVYESMGRVWYERSTDNGTTWILMNNGHPVNPGGNAKSPSICENLSVAGLFIVYQCDNPPYDGIVITKFGLTLNDNTPLAVGVIGQITDYNHANDYQPVIAATGSDGGVVVCNPPIIGFRAFNFSVSGSNITTSEFSIPSSPNSSNPSIVAFLGRTHLVFQEAGLSIKYYSWLPGNPTYSSTVSVSSGTTYNLKPVISLLYGGKVVVSWIGATTGYYPTRLNTRVGTPSGSNINWGSYNTIYGLVSSTSNASNISSTQQLSLITWKDMYGTKWQKRETIGSNIVYSNPSALSNNGTWTQATIGVGENLGVTSAKALVFNTSSLPYYFIPASNNFAENNNSSNRSLTEGGVGNYFLGKVTDEDTILTFGRSGVAAINDVEFVFEIGDILVGDSVIRFIEIPDTLVYNSANELNQHTRTNNFTLTPNTNFYFSNIYHVVQKSDPDTALLSTDAVNFKAELVNANNNQVVGTFDNITYNKNSVEKYASIDYSVDCSGITAGEYYLRLVTNVNGNASYTLANIFNENTTLAKKNYNQIKFTGSEIPTTYDLAQNFPNPFNPSTTIRFQIPQDGIVTLKIYDILGAEVATLVNEQKVAGKYEVNFNASTLASGVYIYKLQAGDFVSSKKMILIK